jgi:hypothetical protein
MGWTTTNKPSYISAKEYIEKNVLTWSSPTHTYRVLDGGVKNFRTYYGAVEKVENSTGNRQVFAVIILLQYYRNDYYNFGYKDMSEDVGPYEAECPERILNLLTETSSDYANKWRQACRDKIAAKKKKVSVDVGAKIKYAGVDYLVLKNLGRRGYTVQNNNGMIFRMKTTQAAEAVII